MIPRFCPELTQEQMESILVKPYESGQMEHLFKKMLGSLEVLALASGREALFQAMDLAGVGPGDEVILPSLNCSAVAAAVLATGAAPVLADVCEEDYTLDPAELERCRTPHTKAVIAVHFNGIPCRMDEIQAWCKTHKLILIEDAAQALGVAYKEKWAGTLGDFGIFSFAFDKHITAGGGGLLAVNNPQYLEGLMRKERSGTKPSLSEEDRILKRLKRNLYLFLPSHYGWAKPLLRVANKLRPVPELPFTKEKVHLLGERQAALITAQLGKLDEWNQARRKRVGLYAQSLEDAGAAQWGKLPQLGSETAVAVPLRYTIRLTPEERNTAAAALLHAGIEAGPFIYSASLHQKQEVAAKSRYEEKYLYRSGVLPQELLNLPVHSHVTPDIIGRVVKVLKDAVGKGTS